MTLAQFISLHDNQPVDVDGEFGAQCWDLVELYAEQVLGVPRAPWAITLGPNGDAHEAWTVFDAHMQEFFDKIPTGQQQPGDINVYDAKPGFPAGHICIDLGGGNVFQQNAPIEGSPAHTGARATSYLLGSLRLKEIAMGVTIVGTPASVSWGEGRIDVFAKGSDGGLWHKWFDQNGWSVWEKLPGGIKDSPSAASWTTGRLDVFGTGEVGDLYHWWFDSKWNGPESLGQPE